MITIEDVNTFLKIFHDKMNIWGIYFRDDRSKNTQTIADLEIRPADRRKIISQLQFSDYCEGPIEDKLWASRDMWVFGRRVKDKEIYIKISMGFPSDKVICISFHTAEFPLEYPFKN